MQNLLEPTIVLMEKRDSEEVPMETSASMDTTTVVQSFAPNAPTCILVNYSPSSASTSGESDDDNDIDGGANRALAASGCEGPMPKIVTSSAKRMIYQLRTVFSLLLMQV